MPPVSKKEKAARWRPVSSKGPIILASVEPKDHLAFRLGLRGNGVVLYSTTCGAEALSFGIETADMDNAVAVVAPRGKEHEILSAMLGGAEYCALLVSTAWAEKAHLAPCAGHAGFPMFKVMPPSLSASTRACSRVRVPVMPDRVAGGPCWG